MYWYRITYLAFFNCVLIWHCIHCMLKYFKCFFFVGFFFFSYDKIICKPNDSFFSNSFRDTSQQCDSNDKLQIKTYTFRLRSMTALKCAIDTSTQVTCIKRHFQFNKTDVIHTCCWILASGAVTICFNDLSVLASSQDLLRA